MTAYGDIDQGQHLLQLGLAALRNRAIIWTNVLLLINLL